MFSLYSQAERTAEETPSLVCCFTEAFASGLTAGTTTSVVVLGVDTYIYSTLLSELLPVGFEEFWSLSPDGVGAGVVESAFVSDFEVSGVGTTSVLVSVVPVAPLSLLLSGVGAGDGVGDGVGDGAGPKDSVAVSTL